MSTIPILEQMTAEKQVTEEGTSWLSQALDPFHDFSRRPTGYPDLTNGNSLVQEVTLSKTITLTEAGDVHVYTMPILTSATLFQGQMSNNQVIDDQSSFFGYGPNVDSRVGLVNIAVAATGENTVPYYNPISGSPEYSNLLQLEYFDFSDYLVGNSRLVSLGFEVINTSPELVKSGAVITYRSPQVLETSNVVFSSGEDGYKFHPVTRLALPPATPEQALLLHGSQQWDAYEGCYAVASLSTINNPPASRNYTDPLFLDSSLAQHGHPFLFQRKSTIFPSEFSNTQYTPWNTSGAYFTGLSATTSLTVSVKAFIECFPTPDQKAFVTLTGPACEYDPRIMEFYARASYRLKPAVPRNMNPAGEYWQIVKKIIGTVAPRAHKAVSMAKEATVIGRDVSQAAKQAKVLMQENRSAMKGMKATKNYAAQSTGNHLTLASRK